jgi:flavorubredoxin
MIPIHEENGHRNVMYNDLGTGTMVQANQHVIVHEKQGIILDPGGHKIYTQLFSQMSSVVSVDNLKYVFFSHQDPDIIAAANGWLMVTDARAYLSELWMRFIPHFGVDRLVIDRIKPIPDEGTTLSLGGAELRIIPAHFLHSAGNFQLYDPVARILYSGDLGASLGCDYDFVHDFDEHIQYMEGFHKRYMPTSRALKMWVNTIKDLDIETIAPQHGAILKGKETVGRFVNWIDGLKCGLDLMEKP